MTDKITFYYNPMSRARLSHWMLEETEAPYEIKVVDWKDGSIKTPEYLKINPMGKVPAIVHKGVVVTEGAAICTYLADAFPEKNLSPAFNDPRRGSFYRWMFFSINCVEQAVIDRAIPRIKELPSSSLGYGSFDDTMRTLEDAVKNNFLIGDQFTSADLYLSANLNWYFVTKMMEPTPILQKYVDRCINRPSFKRADDISKQYM